MSRLACFLMLGAANLVVGCSGPKMVAAKGRVVSGGQPLKVGEKGVLQVILVPEGLEQSVDLTTFPANVDNQQGTFDVYGGVPPGRYKFIIQWLDPYPLTDKLKDKFSMEKSPIVLEVTGEPLEIDIATY
jgi:hypothetical protein